MAMSVLSSVARPIIPVRCDSAADAACRVALRCADGESREHEGEGEPSGGRPAGRKGVHRLGRGARPGAPGRPRAGRTRGRSGPGGPPPVLPRRGRGRGPGDGRPCHVGADGHHRPRGLRQSRVGGRRRVRWGGRPREQRVPLRCLQELRRSRSRRLAQDHGHQPLRLTPDDPGRPAGHARAGAGPS